MIKTIKTHFGLDATPLTKHEEDSKNSNKKDKDGFFSGLFASNKKKK